ncbi:MAG: hypothetical protein U0R24_03215 [Solirubrobacterales bacterium]
MGAPAVSAPRRAAKPKPKPRAAAAKPRSRAATAQPKPRATARPKARAAARPAAQPRTRTGSGAVAGAGNVVMLPVSAVSGIADSGLVTRMTRSRLWIGVLGLLLGGIVAINVLGLGLSASSSTTESRIDSLQSDNGVLRMREAKRLSTEEIQQKAAALGLFVPAPDAIKYLRSGGDDAAVAAKRLAAGEITAGTPAAEDGAVADAADDVATTVDPAATTTTDPAAAATTPSEPIIDPNTGQPAVDPATGAPIIAVDPVTGAAITG